MNTITRWNPFQRETWDPFKDLESFEQRLTSRFGRLLGKPNGEGGEALTLAEWTPLVDISEDEKEFLIKAELPGLKKEEIQVSLDNGMLTISGERKTEKEEKTKKYHRVERAYGKFERSFTLPDKADSTKVNAEFKDGVLQVRLPKLEKTSATAKEVKIS